MNRTSEGLQNVATTTALPSEPSSGQFEIRRLKPTDAGEIALFLERWQREQNGAQGSTDEVLRARLIWLLEKNPWMRNAKECGVCVRNSSGTMVGMILYYLHRFIVDDRRLNAMCSGSFFVEPAARMQGFFLFRHYLRAERADLYFGTTCNRSSGELWKRVGGKAVPNSDLEYILPLQLSRMIPALVGMKTRNRAVERAAAAVGTLLGHVTRPGRSFDSSLLIERCTDWEKLAALAERYRQRSLIATERSPEFLAWRYGEENPDAPEVYTVRDSVGNEGWVAMGRMRRGRQGQIHASLLLDAVWPHPEMEFKQMLGAALRSTTAAASDALILYPRAAINVANMSRWLLVRRLPGPQGFVLAHRGCAGVDAARMDLVPADGDSAW